MLTKEQEEQAKEIARDIAERAAKGEFGWVIGRNGWSSEEEFQAYMKERKFTYVIKDSGVYPCT
jgi:hypothetical protein